jgi:hypothetical protein
MRDETEGIRRQMVDEINGAAAERKEMEQRHGQVWNTKELQEDFQVTGFLAPCVVVVRRSDGVAGSLLFQGSPRLYFNWEEAEK